MKYNAFSLFSALLTRCHCFWYCLYYHHHHRPHLPSLSRTWIVPLTSSSSIIIVAGTHRHLSSSSAVIIIIIIANHRRSSSRILTSTLHRESSSSTIIIAGNHRHKPSSSPVIIIAGIPRRLSSSTSSRIIVSSSSRMSSLSTSVANIDTIIIANIYQHRREHRTHQPSSRTSDSSSIVELVHSPTIIVANIGLTYPRLPPLSIPATANDEATITTTWGGSVYL